MALTIWATKNGVAVSNGPIFTALSGEIVLTELGQFSHGTVTCPGADARVIAAMPEFTEFEIHQDGLGKIGDGYVVNPRQTVDEQDNHTVTFDLEPLTLECTWDRTLPEWEVDGALSVVYSRLAGLVIPQGGAPQWQFNFIGAGTAADIPVSVNHNNPTILKAALDTAKQFDQFVRQGVDATGAPTRILEIGQFGAAPTQWLTFANGADPDAMATNDLVKVVATIEREPNNAIDLVNVVAPYGGGQDIASMVTLERLWRIINDPGYVNYGRYGTNDESRARTGKDSVFPEYDGVNYPISDPRNPPTGNWVYIFPATGATVSPSAGNTIAQIVAAGGVLHQGPFGTRRFTTAGRGVYFVYDAVSYATYGYKSGEFIDSSITYGNDTSVANQEQIARALYVETTTNFKRFAHPHHTFTCTVENDIGRPTRAGDLIAVDVQRVSAGLDGAVQEMNVVENLKVMKWTRTFNGDAPPVGTITLSNLGRFDQDDTTAAADQAKTLVALQRRQDTGLAPYPLVFAGNVDALHPLTIWVLVPDELFRWHRFRMRVDFLPFTGTSTTAVNQTGTQIIAVGGVDILLPTPADVAIAGGNHNGTGFVSDSALIGGMPAHIHTTGATAGGGGAPTSTSQWVEAFEVDATYAQLSRHNGGFRLLKTSPQILSIDLNPTAHTTVTPMQKTIRAAGSTIAHIPAGTHLADLPLHAHPVNQEIPDGPLAPNASVTMNGQSLSSGLALTSGSRNADGTFPGSFSVSDMSNAANAIKGDFPLVFTPGTSAGNAKGVGRFQVTLMGFGEFGGLASTFTG